MTPDLFTPETHPPPEPPKPARELHRVARCSADGCDAEIIWCRNTSTGRAMPVDADPHPQGNIQIHAPHSDRSMPSMSVQNPRRAAVARMAGTKFHLSHFKTCPAAADFRKGGRR